MKLAILSANGKAGKRIAQEAVRRGHDVTAIVRSENVSAAQTVLRKDVFELTQDDLKDYDAVINAFGAWTEETLPGHELLAKQLVDALQGTTIPLFIVGGAGSLYVDAECTQMVMDTPDFPAVYLPVAKAMADGLHVYRQASDLKWIYISPAAEFDVDGPRTGSYQLAGEVFQVNEGGESYISYADYAVAVVDLVETSTPPYGRVSVFS